jgi:hypothetical protein
MSPTIPTRSVNTTANQMKTFKNKLMALFVMLSVLAFSAGSAFATDTPPLDLTATGTSVASYIATAAGAGVAILAALYGVRVIIRAFKSVK